jgi:hypothetical protein
VPPPREHGAGGYGPPPHMQPGSGWGARGQQQGPDAYREDLGGGAPGGWRRGPPQGQGYGGEQGGTSFFER